MTAATSPQQHHFVVYSIGEGGSVFMINDDVLRLLSLVNIITLSVAAADVRGSTRRSNYSSQLLVLLVSLTESL